MLIVLNFLPNVNDKLPWKKSLVFLIDSRLTNSQPSQWDGNFSPVMVTESPYQGNWRLYCCPEGKKVEWVTVYRQNLYLIRQYCCRPFVSGLKIGKLWKEVCCTWERYTCNRYVKCLEYLPYQIAYLILSILRVGALFCFCIHYSVTLFCSKLFC